MRGRWTGGRMFWLVPAAFAADPASIWAGSRWSLAIEETTPAPVELSAEENYSFPTRAIQVEAVMSCPSATAGAKQIEVSCTLDAIAVRATPRTLSPAEATNPANERVLDSIISRLQGTTVAIIVGHDGRLVDVDLPAITVRTRRESESRESLRRLVFDLVAGFHLRHPEDWTGGWTEKNTALLRAPTQPASSGLSMMKNSVSQVNG